MTTEKSYTNWYFLLTVLIIYLITFILNKTKIFFAFEFALDIFLKIIPIFIFTFILMFITNYFIKPKTLVEYMGKNSGIKGWTIAIVSGILSSGPIYMWYPLLNDLQKHGVRNGLLVTFLYNRSVKIPLIPLIVVYFGLTYTIVLLIVTIIMSVAQGLLVEKIIDKKI